MITFGRVLVSELADEEISEKINQNVKILGRNKLQAHITDLWVQILRVFDDVGTKVTVRQMFYQCEVRGAVPKCPDGVYSGPLGVYCLPLPAESVDPKLLFHFEDSCLLVDKVPRADQINFRVQMEALS